MNLGELLASRVVSAQDKIRTCRFFALELNLNSLEIVINHILKKSPPKLKYIFKKRIWENNLFTQFNNSNRQCGCVVTYLKKNSNILSVTCFGPVPYILYTSSVSG